jgi:hypothetical protein
MRSQNGRTWVEMREAWYERAADATGQFQKVALSLGAMRVAWSNVIPTRDSRMECGGVLQGLLCWARRAV